MKSIKVALMDEYKKTFTEGKNFVGYAKGFLEEGCIVVQLDPYTIDFSKRIAKCYPLNLRNGVFYRDDKRKELGLNSFDVIMDLSDVVDLDFARNLTKIKTLHVNDPMATYFSADKRTYVENYPEFIPDTIVSSKISFLKRMLHDRFGGIFVVKDPFSSGGNGVERVSEEDLNHEDILMKMTENGRKQVVAQKFIHFPEKSSKRVAVVGDVKNPDSYRIIHFYGRKSVDGNWKDNLSLGGLAVEVDKLRPDEEDLCLSVARRSGLYAVGLDIMDDFGFSGMPISRLIETNAVLSFSVDGKYVNDLKKVTDFVLKELILK